MKKMHRLILLSSTYRMSGKADPTVIAADPENRTCPVFRRGGWRPRNCSIRCSAAPTSSIRQESGKPLDVQKSLGRAMYVLTTNRAPPGLGPEVRKMLTLFDLDMNGATVDRRPQSNTAGPVALLAQQPAAEILRREIRRSIAEDGQA